MSKQNGRNFADDILKCIFMSENVWIWIEISLKFVPKGPIDNIPALVQIMAWCRTGAKPLSEQTRDPPPPQCPMITHTSDSHEFPCQSYKFWKIAKNSNFEILTESLHATHLLKLLDKMYKYEMDPTRNVGATEQTRDAGWTDGQTDRRTDGQSETNNKLRCSGGIMMSQVADEYMAHLASMS